MAMHGSVPRTAIWKKWAHPTKHLSKAYALRDRTSERERLYIDSHYNMMVTGDLDKAAATFREWIQTYPRDEGPRTNLGIVTRRWAIRRNPWNVSRGIESRPTKPAELFESGFAFRFAGRLDERGSHSRKRSAKTSNRQLCTLTSTRLISCEAIRRGWPRLWRGPTASPGLEEF